MKQIAMQKALVLGVACLLCAACTEPVPLYGTWSDNRGNTFSFFEDGTFNAKVTVAGGVRNNYEGNYSVLLNALTLSCTNAELRVVTEWDIRGNMLYFDWINEDGVALSMTLYKVSN
jgi:hypothetical protein